MPACPTRLPSGSLAACPPRPPHSHPALQNISYNLPQFYFCFFNMFSGQIVYDSWVTMLYNIVFTFFPIMFLATWDQDLPADVLEKASARDSHHPLF